MIQALDLDAFAEDWIAAWNSHDLERIMAHYTPDVVYESPVITEWYGEASGKVEGIGALRAYWQGGLKMQPDLHFDLKEIYAGVGGGVIRYYSRTRGCEVTEVFFFGSDGRVTRASAFYAD